jgi:hypothetical protein
MASYSRFANTWRSTQVRGIMVVVIVVVDRYRFLEYITNSRAHRYVCGRFVLSSGMWPFHFSQPISLDHSDVWRY